MGRVTSHRIYFYLRMNPLEISLVQPNELPALCQLVKEVFHAHIAPLLSKEGIQSFEALFTPKQLLEKQKQGYILWKLHHGPQLLGLVGLDKAHIRYLFIRNSHNAQGAGKKTLDFVFHYLATQEVKEVTVFSSPNSVGFYKKQGFVPTGPEEEKNGIRFTPMARPLSTH